MHTFQILINWDRGQAFSERMSAKILDLEGYKNIDPQSPMGGPDGTKDILCNKDGKKYIAGCYFPNGQKLDKDIREKINQDLVGAIKNNADGFIFLTNQKITPGERLALIAAAPCELEIFHQERICGVLDSPRGYGVRLEYLNIALSKEEQISFLNTHINLEQEFRDIKYSLNDLKKVTNHIVRLVTARDNNQHSATSLPISGVNFSSRLSIEDLLALQNVILIQTRQEDYTPFLGFRKIDVWIGTPGTGIEEADFIPPPPDAIPQLTEKLLLWWRELYETINDGSEEDKIFAISDFHERFLTIHPFMDGNGRVARSIVTLQFKDLLNRNVIFDKVEPSIYYYALQLARNGKSKDLVEIFSSLVI